MAVILSYRYPAPYEAALSAATRALLTGAFFKVHRDAKEGRLSCVTTASDRVLVDVVDAGQGSTVVTVSVRTPWFGVELLGRRKRVCNRVHDAIGRYMGITVRPPSAPPARQVPMALLMRRRTERKQAARSRWRQRRAKTE